MNIVLQRLHNQRLVGKKFGTPHEAVSRLGAVQSQDYAAAKWALGLRVKDATDESIEQAFNGGTILRTHVMRPTWHFVMPEDIRWMLELTAPRVKALMAHYNRKLELDDKLFAKSSAAIVRTLRGHAYLTRQELKTVLERIGIKTNVQRLAHIIMWAELDGFICSGPRRGKQFTYALLEERVPKVKEIGHDDALWRLALKYFTSHGPAQLKDFAWWSGLSSKDAQQGLDSVKSKLIQEIQEGKTYWMSPTSHSGVRRTIESRAYLLSIYDEYTIAYRDRSALGGEQYAEKLLSMGNALTSVIILDGKIVGTWKRIIKMNTVHISLKPFAPPTNDQKKALKSAADHYGKFLGMGVTLSV